MMKRILRLATRWLLLFLGLVILFTGLMVAAYAIPDRWIAQSTNAALQTLRAEDKAGNRIKLGSRAIILDYGTEKRMYGYALREADEGIFTRAMVPHYARYWHGYQAYLRPALAVGSLRQIRWGNALLQAALLLSLLALLAKRLGLRYAICLALALALAGYAAVPLLFQYSGVFLILLPAANLLLLLYDKPWFRRRIPQFFFCIGAFTVFVDLLTAPVVTLGVPLVLLLLLRAKEPEPPKGVLPVLGVSAAWGAGYTALWFAKWCIASLVLRRNEIRISIEQILFRTGASSEGYIRIDLGEDAQLQQWRATGILSRFVAPLKALFSIGVPELLLFFLLLAGLAIYARRKGRKCAKPLATQLKLAALLPLLWMFALGQHTTIHYWFTYRNLAVLVFALLCACLPKKGELHDETVPASG
ncbi:MAG: hypothetical protein LBS96_10100 [Oscillospiraceae bacterium]|jgi:hypothetical protein|nr:hypothetical protein [Oscillospiraceae bacterium]